MNGCNEYLEKCSPIQRHKFAHTFVSDILPTTKVAGFLRHTSAFNAVVCEQTGLYSPMPQFIRFPVYNRTFLRKA